MLELIPGAPREGAPSPAHPARHERGVFRFDLEDEAVYLLYDFTGARVARLVVPQSAADTDLVARHLDALLEEHEMALPPDVWETWLARDAARLGIPLE